VLFTVDREARAAYIHLGAGEVARTILVTDTLNVDLAADGTVVGVELLD
jgi:uncharacterized protein YuzE